MSDTATSVWTHLATFVGSSGFGAAVVMWIKSRGEVAVAELDAGTKMREANVHERETTGEQVLAAWKITLDQVHIALEQVKVERAALEASRAESETARSAARLEREAAEAARRQARLDQELAESAMNQNEECQQALAEVRGRLEALEAVHAECPKQIAELVAAQTKLKNDVRLLKFLHRKSDMPPEPDDEDSL